MLNQIGSYEGMEIRKIWDEKSEEWYFSVVDVVAALTGSPEPRNYWKVLKKRLKDEGNQSVTDCNQLKLKAADGKYYKTDVATTEQLFRLIQSIPSPKAEPMKMWLAEVGRERIEETIDPEKAMTRAASTYAKKGYSKEWIRQRMLSVEVRNELTSEWKEHGIKEGYEYAALTDELTKAWAGMNTKEYKVHKGLKKGNLRDNMTTTELVLNMLAETTTKDITEIENPMTFDENKDIARRGGNIAGDARKAIERETGRKVITSENAETLGLTKGRRALQ